MEKTTVLKNRSALLLIDVQTGFNDKLWGKPSQPGFEENIEVLLKHYRRLKKPIYHVQHLSRNPKSPLFPGQVGVDFMDFAKPERGERIFQKHVNSAFIGTHLEETLRQDGIQSLIVCGIAVDHCVSTTTRMAANLGFEVFVAADATLAHGRKGFDGIRYDADLVQAITLASLHQEFATVMKTQTLIDVVVT